MNGDFKVAAAISAGWSPSEDDPLASYTQGRSKALIPIAGKPMISHVVDALVASRCVKHIVIVALDPDDRLPFPVPVQYVPDAGDILANAEAGFQFVLDHYSGLDGILLCTCDVPTITGHIVDAFVEECLSTDHNLYYSIIERSVMEERFPGARRSYVHLREGDYAGGDIILVRPDLGFDQRDLWQRLAAARKNPLHQARLIGLGFFLKLLTHRLSLSDAEQRVSQILNVNGRAVPFSYAEIGMDVDKPLQLEIVRADLEARAAPLS